MRYSNQLLLLLTTALTSSTDAKRHSPSWGLSTPITSRSITSTNNNDHSAFDLQKRNKQLYSALAINGGATDSGDDTDDDSDDDTDNTDSEDEVSDDDDDDADADVEEEDEYDEETEDDDTDEYDDEESEEEEVIKTKATPLRTSIKQKSKSKAKAKVVENVVYDEPLSLSPIQDMGVTLGVMLLCNKLDLTNTKIIRYARYVSRVSFGIEPCSIR